jgi:hypothetical protein
MKVKQLSRTEKRALVALIEKAALAISLKNVSKQLTKKGH